MTARDAANLLIATISTPVSGPSVKSTLTQWSAYSALTASGGDLSFKEPLRFEHLDSGKWCHQASNSNLVDLSEEHTLTGAVSTLISFNIYAVRLRVASPIPAAELFVSNRNGFEAHYYVSKLL